MTLRQFILGTLATAYFCAFSLIPLAGALSYESSVTGSDESEGDVQDTDCANLDDSMAAAMGCDTSDQITDFTQYTGSLEGPDASGYDEALTQNTNARDLIQTIVNYALSFLGLVAIVMVIYGGIMYVMSRGDTDMTTKGKNAITYASIGIIIILSSYALVNTIIGVGGGSTDSGDGTATGGETITEAGAAFDVDAVLNEIEGIAVDYKTTYDTYLAVTQEIEYLQSIEMPLIISVAESDNTLGGVVEAIGEWATGTDDDYTDQYTLTDEADIEAYLSDLKKGIQTIQSQVDPLSDTYESAQAMYNYLKSGTNTSSNFLKQIASLLAPQANAESATTGSTCYNTTLSSDTTRDYGAGWTVYDTDVSAIDENICGMLLSIQEKANSDYEEQVAIIVNRFEDMRALFDTESLSGYDSGSQLNTVLEKFEYIYDSEGTDGLLNKLYNDSHGNYAEVADNTRIATVTANNTRNLINALNDLHEIVANIQFVKVRLTASAVEGNADMIVRFTALGTEDPSGQTVTDEQIQWDLDGDLNFETISNSGVSSQTDTSSGGLPGVFSSASREPTGATVSAIYSSAGTYRVRVRVLSSDANIAAGLATVSILVNPPRSQIILKATTGTSESDKTVIADYSTFPIVDKDSYKTTITEADSGVTFDASETMDGNSNKEGIVFYEWDFGDNNIVSGNSSEAATVQHSFTSEGSFDVSLKVIDQTGVEDFKYFKVVVSTLASHISYSPETGGIGTTFTFDGTGSAVNLGNISSYQWTATLNGQAIALTDSTKSTLSAKFNDPGVYAVTLLVADSSGKTDSMSINVLVESTPPVAIYTYDSVSENEPATILFDAGDSYDPDANDAITYAWTFGDALAGEDYKVVDGDAKSKELTVQFLKVDDYEVTLTVFDQYEAGIQKSDTATATIAIASVLDVDLTVDGEGARHLNAEGKASVEFTALSSTATGLEIDYGDGKTDFSDTITRGQVIFTHDYEQAGIFYVTLTAYDDTDNKISVTRRVYIGTGDAPIAVIDVSSDGKDIGFGSTLTGSVKTKFTFDARNSVNLDGSTNNLTYFWNFGDGTTASQAEVTHTFDEQTTYTVSLTAKDRSDSSIGGDSTIQIKISNIAPRIRGITVTPQGTTMQTPLNVNVTIDATDEDGKVNYVKAWYYDLNDTAEQLGMVTSPSASFTLKINTNGQEGDSKEYGFAAEVTDDDNQTVSSFDELLSTEIPTLAVVNGQNDTPLASFTVNKTSVYVGEEVTFSSTSYDTDGTIVKYWWDIDGNGIFSDNDPEEKSSYVYQFTQVHPDGVNVKLKVEDSSGATSESNAVKIYVDSIANPPDAKFLTDVNGTTVTFKNNSSFDGDNGSTFEGIYWDFDTTVDSDGNSVPDNDLDSLEENPVRTYDALGTYQVKMTIVDNLGQTDTVTQDVKVLETTAPVADFSYTVVDKKVEFKDKSTFDTANGVEARSYTWDFDIDLEDDTNSDVKNPSYEYADYGTYNAKLVVQDSMGKTSTITKEVEVKNPVQPVIAYLSSTPEANILSQIVLDTDGQEVTFYFNGEGGNNSYTYTLDKNIFYDTNGDSIRDNDADYTATASGKWKTPFYKSYGQVVTKLTVTDNETGEKDVATLQVVFKGSTGSANLFNATPNDMLLLIFGALLASIAGVGMAFRYKPLKTR